MFDLGFCAAVRRVLAWSEAPASHFANPHERALMTRGALPRFGDDNATRARRLDERAQLLWLYVQHTYPRYFGFRLRFGDYAARRGGPLHVEPPRG